MASSSSINTETTSPASSNTTPTSLIQVHHLITIKLTRDNYLLWKAHIVPYLKGQHLYGFLDGSRPTPLPVLTTHIDDPLSIEDLYDHLLTHEIQLAQNQPVVDLSMARANLTTSTNSSRGGRGGKLTNSFPQSGRGSNNTNQRNNRGKGRSGFSSNCPTFQVCNKTGHVALQCYHRFDNSYSNSGATHHLTADLANLNLHADDYNGPDQIRVDPPPPLPFFETSSSLSVQPTSHLAPHPVVTHSKNHITKPKTSTDGSIQYPIPRAILVAADSTTIEPTCYTRAVKSPEWCTTMNLEFDALLKSNTWILVSQSKARNLVGCKWVFRIKRKADGSIKRHKVRLVAKGFHQQPGIDYGEMFSPIIKPTMLSGWLIQLGFQGSRSDKSLFILKHVSFTMYVLIYVDDIIITCSKAAAIDDLLQLLSSDFAVKDLDKLNFFLGIKVIENEAGVILSQQRYILDILKHTNMQDAKLVSSPMASSTSLSAYEGESFPDHTLYHNTATVACFNTEVEYKVLANTVVELKWLHSLFCELGVALSFPPILWCDNIGATYLSSNPVFHARTKHVEIDFHFVGDMVANKSNYVRFLCSKDQMAGLLTKPISSSRFPLLRTKLNSFLYHWA
uniref:Reverse transcriptase Ty1/copia-type domain-containing protein n=1 Tax=Fagus sylvatica TaxID=28930 RepID=A0A2N9HHK9_FAGSY